MCVSCVFHQIEFTIESMCINQGTVNAGQPTVTMTIDA